LSPGVIAAKDFMHDRVLDRLLMYERRIESSLYRTMNELRKLQHEQDRESGAAVRTVPARASVGAGPCARPGQPQGVAPTASPWGAAADAADSAKQSQSTAGDGVQCTPYETAGVTPDGTDFAKQSQLTPGDGARCTPCESGDKSPVEETPHGITTNAGDRAEQSQRPASPAAAIA